MSKLTFVPRVEGDDEIGCEMICVDLRGAVARRISGRSEHDVGPLVGVTAGVKALGTGAADTDPVGEAFAAQMREQDLSAIGDRQILPVHTNVT
ncbi:hypothetical protein GCM10020255_089750 [Rhodococcus baikonurensis]